MLRRIKHDYRQMGGTPAKFLGFSQKVIQSLTGNPNYPDSIWGANTNLWRKYIEHVDRLGVACHVASGGDRNLIRDRDKLIQEVILILEEIASLLEAASIRNPDALFTTGFTVTQERRTANRTRLQLTAPMDFAVVNTGERGKAVGSAMTQPGAFNHEMHINRNDPSVEGDWHHMAIYTSTAEMVMENLDLGNIFFRMRHHGPDGPGPWSPTVSTTIT